MHYQHSHHGQIGSPTNPAQKYGGVGRDAGHLLGDAHKLTDKTSPGQMLKGYAQEKFYG